MAGPPLSRQIGYLIDRRAYQHDLRLSSLLSDVAHDPSTSSSEWHRLSLRINSLLHPNQDLTRALRLAREMVREVPWEAVVTYASHWISSALTHFALAVKDAIALLNSLLGQDARERSEYWRNVASMNVSKYAVALLDTVEADQALVGSTLAIALQALTEQTRLYPTVYRPHAVQLQKLCNRLLVERRDVTADVSSLLASLHVTGKGQANQTQLWTTTLNLLLEDAKIAWAACSSSFEGANEQGEEGVGLMGALPSDDMEALEEGQSRLMLLLGRPPAAGIIGVFLSEPTNHTVPVPMDSMVSLVLSILSVTSSSPPRQQPPPEASLYAAQTALLPAAHVAALTLLASLPLGVHYAKTNKILSRLLRLIEKSSPAVRCVGLKVLEVMDLPLDPESSILIHGARTCLAQVARLLQVNSSTAAMLSDKMQAEEKATKRRRIYESDQVQFSQRRGFVELDDDEYEACIAAIGCLRLFYTSLATHISAEHHDLAHTTALVMLGISEIALHQPDDLSAASLGSLGQLVRLSRGPILALLTTRAASLAAQGLVCHHGGTKTSATSLLHALEFTFNPRLAPKLSLRLHVEADQWKGGEEEVELGKVELEEGPAGAREAQALRDVLAITADREQDWSAAASPRVESQRPRPAAVQFSPDPVKPIRRSSTPRIGSPTAGAANVLAPMAPRSSESPERPTSTHLFGGPSSVAAAAMAATTTQPLAISSPLAQQDVTMSDESDDDAIPELDLRSSDEESDEEALEE